MAWEWSHTVEAMQNAAANVKAKDREWLRTVYAEWKAKQPSAYDADHDGFSMVAFKSAVLQSERLYDGSMADYICDKMEQQALCDNGGHSAWACPYGCHKVSFDLENHVTRQTFSVDKFRKFVNDQLAKPERHSDITGATYLTQDEKRGLCSALEHVLHKTGNYAGFNYVYWLEHGFHEWEAAGEPGFPEKQKFLGPEYDRYYYGKSRP